MTILMWFLNSSHQKMAMYKFSCNLDVNFLRFCAKCILNRRESFAALRILAQKGPGTKCLYLKNRNLSWNFEHIIFSWNVASVPNFIKFGEGGWHDQLISHGMTLLHNRVNDNYNYITFFHQLLKNTNFKTKLTNCCIPGPEINILPLPDMLSGRAKPYVGHFATIPVNDVRQS